MPTPAFCVSDISVPVYVVDLVELDQQFVCERSTAVLCLRDGRFITLIASKL